jgi:hypothetical protein
MTKPIYFPHTYMSPPVAAAIRAVFPAVAGYLPAAGRMTPDMQELVESGFLEVAAPLANDEERMDRVLRELERWGRMQQGGAGLLAVWLSNRPGSDPLRADGTASQIAAAIRKGPADEPLSAEEALLRSAAFLQLAHQADFQSHQVHTELQRCEQAHAELFQAIAEGGPRPASASFGPPAVPPRPEGDLLLGQRVRAWSRLFLHRPYPGPVFVTASAQAAGRLAEEFPALRRIDWSALGQMTGADGASPTFGPAAGGLMSRLEMLASLPLPEVRGGEADGSQGPLIYALADLPPLRLFAHLAQSDAAPEAPAAAPIWRHTVVVDFSPKK